MHQWCEEVRRKCEKRGALNVNCFLYVNGDHSLSQLLGKRRQKVEKDRGRSRVPR